MNEVGLNGDFLDFSSASDDLRFQNLSLALSEMLLKGLGKPFIDFVVRMKDPLMLPDQFGSVPADQFDSCTVTVDDHARFRLGDKYAISGFFEEFPVPFFILQQRLLDQLALNSLFF